MSGMSLAAATTEPRAYRVRTIIDGSPAADAGIAVNDLLTAIDGRPASDVPLAEIRQLFREPGTTSVLTLTRDGTSRQVTIRTRRLI